MNWKLFADHKRRILISLGFALLIVAVYSGAMLLRYGVRGEIPFYEVKPLTENFCIVTLVLAVFIGAYGFSYLHSMKRVDFYHSLPVTAEKRFRSIYLSTCSFYFMGIAAALIVSLIFGVPAGDPGPAMFARSGMALVLTVLFFLTILNITVYAFTLSGNTVIAILIDIVLIFYIDLWERVIELTCDFATHSTFFATKRPDISVIDIYLGAMYPTIRSDVSLSVSAGFFVRACIKLFIWATITFVMCRRKYLRRPAESARSLVAFYSSHMLIKLMVVVPVALLMGNSTYDSFYEYRNVMQIISMILTAIVVSILVEILFSRSLSAAVRKWGSIIFALFVIFTIFGIMRGVEKKYNAYVPATGELESYAVFDPLDSYYYGFNLNFDEDGHVYDYLDAAEYVKENMILTDTEAILKLAGRSVEKDYHEMMSPLPLQVHYRLSNGTVRNRLIWVEMENVSNRKMLNRIVGPAYYKEGIWQAFTENVPEDANVTSIDYHDLMEDEYRHVGEGRESANKLISVWRDAMTMYDYDHVRYKEVAAEIEVHFDGGMYMWVLPLYEDMINEFGEAMLESIE
ncbi:MAG: hypothetical protein K6F54_01805 [Lachnospiraceae bacterium]|nr:hypothetical protein [Lachnospiraceae bacterium]